jgi:predicted permease
MTRWIEAAGQDLRYAIRGLRKSPGFTVVALLTLSIAIGATTAVFSVINGILLRPLPYPNQDRLIALSNVYPKNPQRTEPVSGTDVAHWRGNQVFEHLEFVSHPDIVAMSSEGSGERIAVQHMSAQLLPLLGIKSFLGQIPSDEASEKRGSLGVLISYEFWKQHFGGNSNILGQKIFVDTWSATIVGVLEPGFDLFGTGTPEVYEIDGMPDVTESGINDVRWLVGVGKLKPGVSMSQAQAAMDVQVQQLAEVFPETYKDVRVRVEPLRNRLFGNWAQVYYTLFGVVGFVLLIACANVANLLLVRGDARRKEMGVRIALGANHASVVRQVLSESILLSLIGGTIGLVLAFLGVKIFNVWAPYWLPREVDIFVDIRVLAFTLGTCIFTGLAFGILPALRAMKGGDLNECLRDGARSTATLSRHRTRKFLVVSEIAMALVLLICAGLMINTLTRILRTTPGFNPERLLTAEVRLTGYKYIDSTQVQVYGTDLNVIRPAVGEFCRQLLDRVRNLPGIDDAALIDWLPLLETAQYASPGFAIAGQGESTSSPKPNVLRQAVSADYFRIMGVPVIRGRVITEQDTVANAWIAVINEEFARRSFRDQDPIGRTMQFDDSPDEKPRQIVGIVGNVHQFSLTMMPEPEVYVSYQQMPTRIYPGSTEARIHKSLIIRTHSASKSLMQEVRRTISGLAPESAVFGITPVAQTVSKSATTWRFLCQVLELFAAIALFLAVIGVYGVISYSVRERTHELGLRMALGAQRVQVLALVLRQAMALSFLGVAIGLVASFATTPLLADFLYGVKAHDPLTLVLVSSLLTAITFFASYVPARRVTNIDPMQTLRHE